ncbi:fad nadph dehydrogenase/oxidoreductase [Holotrichia oblita]|uniref:Fad nadph dehydrogenase/oxidoreductase n=1 Tax=Holotrichia oblita TaxID=644536 RepID=A0ACB9SXD4_HOLOL|nr:fad nadph dehydrogenase/oxidoreductase [Holotrichia oblita]
MKKICFKLARALYSTSQNTEVKICVIGSGPAGFYASQHLVKHIPSVKIDIYEKLPVPFGLVRFGVAPDHPEVKNVIHTFNKTAENKNVRFIGNVTLGKDVSFKELKDAYHIVLLTYGAEENRQLNIKGENLHNVIAARNIVGWYNGLPENKDLQINLSKSTAAIIGQGNVAIDVARILLTPIDQLKNTDITQHALEVLSTSKIKEVYLIGRRGPLQAAFTIKELREMLKLKNCSTYWCDSDFVGIRDVVPQLARPRKRLTELMLTSLETTKPNADYNKFKPIFFRSPLEFSGSTGDVEKLKLCVNKLEGADILRQKAVFTEDVEYLSCDLAVTSIGYKSLEVDPAIPFDSNHGIAKNANGKISDGVFTTGWLATGPTGVILSTMSNAFGVAEYIVSDLKKCSIESKPGFASVEKLLEKRGVQLVFWENWLKIDAYEQEMGKKLGKPREKIVTIKKMLEVAE